MSVPTFGPQTTGGWGGAKRQPGRSLGSALGGATATALGAGSLAARGDVTDTSARGSTNAMADVQIGSQLAAVREKHVPRVPVDDLPPTDQFRTSEDGGPMGGATYVYPIEWLQQMQPYYEVDPDVQSKLAFLTEGEGSRRPTRPFGMMGQQRGAFEKRDQQGGGGTQQAQQQGAGENPGQMGGGGGFANMGDNFREGLFGSAEVKQPEVVALATTDKAFTLGAKRDLDDEERLVKTVNGLLNKLTPEKYSKVIRDFLEEDLGITTTPVCMKLTIKEMFKRAIDQSIYVEMYSDLAKDITAAEQEMNLKSEGHAGKSLFRRYLIERVQEEYENRDEEVKKAEEEEDPKEREALLKKCRKKKLGNMKFVGELYNKQLLHDKIIHKVIQGLLYDGQIKIEGDTFYPEEAELEILLELITAIGSTLEKQAKAPGGQAMKGYNDQYFRKMEGMVGKKNAAGKPLYTPRLRFQIMDMFDARRKGWPESAKAKRPGEGAAKKIDDFAREQEEKERRKLEGVREANFSGEGGAFGRAAQVDSAIADLKGGGIGPSSKKGGRKGQKTAGEDGWENAPAAKGGAAKAAATGKKRGPQASGGMFSSIAVAGQAKAADDKTGKERKAAERAAKEAAKAKARAKAEKDAKKKEAKKAREAEEAKVEVDKPPTEDNMPEGFSAKVKGRYAEAHALSAEELKEDFGDLGAPKPLLVQELCRLVVKEKDAEARAAIAAFVKRLEELGVLAAKDVPRGMGWFIATAIQSQMKEDNPKLWDRYLELLLALCPPQKDYMGLSRALSVGFGATDGLLKETGEEEYLEESVAEIFTELWSKVHSGWGEMPVAAEEWQPLVLKEVVDMNARTGWMTADIDGEKKPLIDAQARFLLDSGFIPAERFGAWKSELKGAPDSKRAQKAVALLSGLFEQTFPGESEPGEAAAGGDEEEGGDAASPEPEEEGGDAASPEPQGDGGDAASPAPEGDEE